MSVKWIDPEGRSGAEGWCGVAEAGVGEAVCGAEEIPCAGVDFCLQPDINAAVANSAQTANLFCETIKPVPLENYGCAIPEDGVRAAVAEAGFIWRLSSHISISMAIGPTQNRA